MKDSSQTVVKYHPSMPIEQGLESRAGSLARGKRGAAGANFNAENRVGAIILVSSGVEAL